MFDRRDFMFGAMGSAVVASRGWAAVRPGVVDVVVYGATPAGIVAAVVAAREGASVRLIVPDRHIGGMMTGGLSSTDVGDRPEVIGGYALKVFAAIAGRYGRPAPDPTLRPAEGQRLWDAEPGVCATVFRAMLNDVSIVPEYGRLRERGGVERIHGRIASLHLEDGRRVGGHVFVDATYEGDLMARAGVAYVWGREGRRRHAESLAGVQPDHRTHNFSTLGVKIAARDRSGRWLPGISPLPRGTLGDGDRKVQAYTYRTILTNRPGEFVPFAAPPGYDPGMYELHRRVIAAVTERNGTPPPFNRTVIRSPIPNGKFDINNRGPASTNFINANWEYPDAGYRRQAEIRLAHERYVRGFFYFLATDAALPSVLRDEVRSYGLPRDEYPTNGNWSPQLYVREARRMVGRYVMTQADIQSDVTKPDSIGMGSYRSDSHNVQRFADAQGFAECEGNMEVSITPYQIPYRAITPVQAQADNLLVIAAPSASHVAFSTLRMEPQFMILGHAGGVAAYRAARDRAPVQRVDVPSMQQRLREQGAILSL